jgi:DNA-binding HxlR family transcriptional regulator
MAAKKAAPKRRSGCPLNASVEMLGDRWSLLIVRDMMIRGFQTYKEFLASDERIATNILADRLRKLEGHGIIPLQVQIARRVSEVASALRTWSKSSKRWQRKSYLS